MQLLYPLREYIILIHYFTPPAVVGPNEVKQIWKFCIMNKKISTEISLFHTSILVVPNIPSYKVNQSNLFSLIMFFVGYLPGP